MNPVAPWDWLETLARLATALVVGAAIGWTREAADKPAGLRTYILVSLGAAMFVLVPLEVGGAGMIDSASRALQGVATGVGFLGAGQIIRVHRNGAGEVDSVKGLTSAAAIWVTAALGAVAASGLWKLALTGALVTLFTLTTLRRAERIILRRARAKARAGTAPPSEETAALPSDTEE